jgi:hypothetical protein
MSGAPLRAENMRLWPVAIERLACCTWGAILVAALGGCSCQKNATDESKQAQQQEEDSDAAVLRRDRELKKQREAKAALAARTVVPQASADHRGPAPPRWPTFPADFRQWSVPEFLSARAAGEPRLPAAIRQRAEKPLRNAEEAEMLATLLTVPPPDPASGRNEIFPSSRPLDKRELTLAILAALAANDTPKAHGTIVRIVDGSLPVLDDQAAVDAVLPLLVRYGTPQTEAMVLRAIVAPHELRPSGRGQVGAEGLRKAALAAVRAGASPAFRCKLAESLVNRQCSVDSRNLPQGLLCERAPENLEAQAILYASGTTDPATRATLQTYLIAYSGQLVGRLLGIPIAPSVPGAAGGASLSADSRLLSRMAALWEGDLATAVNQQLEQLESLQAQPGLIVLAGTIPSDAVRQTLYDTLRRNRQDGPQGLETVQLVPPACCDPGLWVALKMLRPLRSDPVYRRSTVKVRKMRPEIIAKKEDRKSVV